MARDGLLPRLGRAHPSEVPGPVATTIVTGVAVALWAMIGDAGETYDLTNIGRYSLSYWCASACSCFATRIRPGSARSRVPFVWPVSLGGAAICLFLMNGLPHITWVRFYVWLVIGLAV